MEKGNKMLVDMLVIGTKSAVKLEDVSDLSPLSCGTV